jgi:SpoVK/Ycf46/Vps4 family AAA+-type ATPase
VDLEALARLCDEYSGADIACVCRDASLMSMRRLMGEARARAKLARDPEDGAGFLAMKVKARRGWGKGTGGIGWGGSRRQNHTRTPSQTSP